MGRKNHLMLPDRIEKLYIVFSPTKAQLGFHIQLIEVALCTLYRIPETVVPYIIYNELPSTGLTTESILKVAKK